MNTASRQVSAFLPCTRPNSHLQSAISQQVGNPVILRDGRAHNIPVATSTSKAVSPL